MARISRCTDQEIIEAVRSSFSIRRALQRLGLHPTGANYLIIHRHFTRLGLDISHFTGQWGRKGKTLSLDARAAPCRDPGGKLTLPFKQVP